MVEDGRTDVEGMGVRSLRRVVEAVGEKSRAREVGGDAKAGR